MLSTKSERSSLSAGGTCQVARISTDVLWPSLPCPENPTPNPTAVFRVLERERMKDPKKLE